jgi:hypothetical protein
MVGFFYVPNLACHKSPMKLKAQTAAPNTFDCDKGIDFITDLKFKFAMKNFSTLHKTARLNNVLNSSQMQQVKGGNKQPAPPPSPSFFNAPGSDCDAPEAVDGNCDDKRRARPGGGGVTTH